MRVWTALVAFIVMGCATIAQAQYSRPWQFHFGVVSPTGDVKNDAGADSGLMLGFDYYLRRMGENGHTFMGARYWQADATGPFTYVNWGMHYGMQWDLSRPKRSDSGLFYFKAALGLFTSAFESSGDIFGSIDPGGILALGYEMGGTSNWGFELGLYFMPDIGVEDNRGWTFGVTYRPG
jgi:hypothetical protein